MTDLLNKETIAGLSVDELLDLSVDQIAEVTPFTPKPTGIYVFEVKACGVVEVGESNAIEVEYNIIEMVQLEDESLAESVGELPAKYTEKYFIGGDSEFGLMTFRTVFGGLVGEGETVAIRELMERCIGATGEGLLKHRKWVNKTTKEKQEGNQWEATSIELR